MKRTAIIGSLSTALAAIAAGQASKLYGYENIRRHLQRQGKRYGRNTSRYMPHQGEQEIARRLRQAERVAVNRRERCVRVNGFGEHGQVGLSRRGYVLVERDGRIQHLDGKAVS